MSRVAAILSAGFLILLGTSPHAIAAELNYQRFKMHKMAFEENLERYPAPLAMLESLARVAPHRPAEASSDPCLRIHQDSASLLGAIEPSQLQALQNEPGEIFYNYYETCTKRIVILGTSDETSAGKNAQDVFGDPLLRKWRGALGGISYVQFWSMPFSRLPADIQSEMLDRMIEFLIGPDELLLHYRYIGENNVYREPIANRQQLAQFLAKNLAQNPAVSIATLYARFATNLRLGPGIKA